MWHTIHLYSTHSHCRNYHHNHPRLAPVICSSVGRATIDEIRKSCFDFRRDQRFFLCLVPSQISLLGLTLSGNFMGSLSTLTYTVSSDPLFDTEKYTDFKCSISQFPKKELKIYTQARSLPEDFVVLPEAISLSALYGIHVRKCGHKVLHFDRTTLVIQANFEPPIRTSVVSALEAAPAMHSSVLSVTQYTVARFWCTFMAQVCRL